jgi:hypothetical protein
VVVAQDAAADAPHHRGVAVDERLERRPVAVADEPVQQLGVGRPARVPQAPGPFEPPED